MSTYLRPIISFVLFLWTINLFSQTVWSGKITNTEGMVLPNVHVMIRDAGNEKIYAFTASSKDGSYTLNYTGERNNKKIVFRLLGYDEEMVDLPAVSFPFNVVLIPTDHVLNEITIKPQAIRIKKDTTEYLVSAFSDGTEQSIEEVLKKMPGIEVSETGAISFKGKQIEKILLDDTDLFDRNYTIASKNIPPDFISTVQAIEKYHNNRLLKNAENSEKVILNFNVREDLKIQRPVGQAYTSGGYKNRYSIQPNMLSLSKKLKLSDALNVNNTGLSSPFSLENHLSTLYENFDTYADAAVVSTPFVSDDDGNMNRAETRQLFNSLNFGYQPVNQLEITGNVLFDQTRKSSMDHTEIWYFPDSLLIENTSHVRTKLQTFYGMIRVKYDIKENMSLIYSGRYNRYDNPATNELFIPEARLYNISGCNQFFMNDLDLTIALRDSSALVFKAAALSNQSSQRFYYSMLENAVTEIDQTAQATTFQYHTSVKYYKKKHKAFFYTLQASLNRNNQDMNINSMHQNEPDKTSASLDDVSFLVDADMTYKKGISTFLFQSGIGYRNQMLTRPDITGKNDRRFEFSPRLSYQIKLERHELSLSGNYTQGRFSLLNYLDRFTGYRGRQSGAEVYTYGSTISYGVFYTYSSPFLQPFFRLGYTNAISKNVYATQTHIGSIMNYSSLIQGNDIKTQLLFTNFKTYMDEIRHGIDFNSSLYVSEYSNAVNSDVLRSNKMLSSTSRFSIKSVYDTPFNYVLGVRFSYSSVQTNLLPQYHTINYSFFQDFLYKPSKRLKMKISVDEYFLGKDRDFYLFIRPDITYLFPKQRLIIGMNAYNILNNTRITDYQIRDFYSSEAYYSIVPAQYLLNVQFQF